MPILVIKVRERSWVLTLVEGKPVFIGRAKECDIHLPFSNVSRRHAAIIFKGGRCGVKDLNSFNGTRLNGERIASARELVHGDVVEVPPAALTYLDRKPDRAGGKPLTSSSRAFAKSGLLLPRAMWNAEAIDGELDAVEWTDAGDGDATGVFVPDGDKVVRRPEKVDDPNETGYFREQPKTAPAPPERVDGGEVPPAPAAKTAIPPGEPEEEELLLLRPDDDALPEEEPPPAPSAAEPVAERDEFLEPDAETGRDETEVIFRGPDRTRPIAVRHLRERASSNLPEIDIPPELEKAVDDRLVLYDLLGDLAEERRILRSSVDLPAEAAAELNRQDAELDDLPTSPELERLLAESRGAAAGPELRSAREMAESQWQLILGSNREALPPLFKEAYRLAADEPLAVELAAAGINHGRLMGGAVYLLVLEKLARAANSERKRVSSRLRAISGEDGDEKGTGVLGRLGRLADSVRRRRENKVESARLHEMDRAGARRSEIALREMHFVEKGVVGEFWRVYYKAALHFIPRYDAIPPAVRAFLRYGVVGVKPWWMVGELRDFIMNDCRDNVRNDFERTSAGLDVLYADEYLSAVFRMECTPAFAEAASRKDRGSPESRAERGYRRIVNARSYGALLQEMLGRLRERGSELERRAAASGEALETAAASAAVNSERLLELGNAREKAVIRSENLARNLRRIETEVVTSILAAVEETEGRFRRGEYVMPAPEDLLRREVAFLADAAARHFGIRERFMPLVLRDLDGSRDGAFNDRERVGAWLEELEKRDPGIFQSVMLPAAKKRNRIELRLPPLAVIAPCAGLSCLCAMAREGMEGGRLAIPACFTRADLREKQLANMAADFRWESAHNLAGLDVMKSDTLAGVFMRLRWEWRNYAKAKREKALIYNELGDKVNWRRVYELYLADAMTGAKQLHQRNPALYAAIIDKFIELPEGVQAVKKV